MRQRDGEAVSTAASGSGTETPRLTDDENKLSIDIYRDASMNYQGKNIANTF